MDAREIESLSMLSRGFTELKEANPELAYNVILDILSGINEYVPFQSHLVLASNLLSATPLYDNMFRPLGGFSRTNASSGRAK
jgi:hypothetical protein